MDTERKRRGKIMFVVDLILYMITPKNPTRKLLEFIIEFSKVSVYKISSQKSVYFLCANNNQE